MQYPGKAITDQYPTRNLCGKRYDNRFSFASSSSGKPHTCFEDTVLVPLASWIFLLALVGYIAYVITAGKRSSSSRKQPYHRLIHRKNTVINDKERDEALVHSNGGAATHTRTTKMPKTYTTLSIIYSLLILATLLMNILEIVRLYLADRGAGLLPFSLASLVIILTLMHIPMPAHTRIATGAVILVFWLFSLIFTAVQLATLTSLSGVEPRIATEYLNSDQVIDVSVIIALYAVEVVVETVRLVHLHRLSR